MPPKLSIDMEEIKKMFSDLGNKIDEIKSETKNIHAELSTVRAEQKKTWEKMETENKFLKKEIEVLSKRCLQLEDEHRKKNLIITGMEYDSNKTEIENFKGIAVKLGLAQTEINSLRIDQAIRMKKKAPGKQGDVIVKFCSTSDKICVLKAAKNAKLKDI